MASFTDPLTGGELRDQISDLFGTDEELVCALEDKVQRARESPEVFAELVYRSEFDYQPVKLGKHQSVGMGFVLDHPRSVNIWPIAHTKCLEASTLIQDPRDGVLRSICDVVVSKHQRRIASWNPEQGVVSETIGGYIDSGQAECLEVRLASGRALTVTRNHPFLAAEGWMNAEDLLPGISVGVPARMPHPEQPKPMPCALVDILAVVLSEGCVRGPKVAFSTSDPEIERIMREAGETYGCHVRKWAKYAYAFTGWVHGNNGVLDVIRKLGMANVLAKHKTIPNAVFSLPASQLARFISVFWMCDGTVGNARNRLCPSITLASQDMVRQFQHLLLRFGVQASMREVEARCNGKSFRAWKLLVRAESMSAFARAFTLWGDKAERLTDRLAAVDQSKRPPRISHAFKLRCRRLHEAHGGKLASMKRAAGRIWHSSLEDMLFQRPNEHGVSAVRPAVLSAFRNIVGVDCGNVFAPGVYWDRIESITPIGIRKVFDLSVPTTRCFVAGDVIVHNSSTATILTLYKTGKNPGQRGAVISATQFQAAKTVAVVGHYIKHNPLMRLVWNLRPGPKWTDTVLVVERAGAIKDPTVAAYGLDTQSILGSRIDWALFDDVLNQENTQTKEQREYVKTKFFSTFYSRLERHRDACAAVMNSAWHPEDLLHHLEKLGWATLRMSVDGNIYVKDDVIDIRDKRLWDHHLLRPVRGGDPSLGELTRVSPVGKMLWPEGFTDTEEDLRTKYPIDAERLRLFYSVCRDDASAFCKAEWIELCKKKARDKGYFNFTFEKKGGQTYTGVDLAVTMRDSGDSTAIFTFEILPDGHRLILDVEIGKWDGPTIVDKLIAVHQRYGSVVRVENNASQKYLVQFLREKGAGIPIKGHMTGMQKANPTYGVQSIFAEMASGAWLIPNDKSGVCHPHMQKVIDNCLYYTPEAHTGDGLMAMWIAREQARAFGALVGTLALGANSRKGSIGAAIMAR
jgi:hypothetical protein